MSKTTAETRAVIREQLAAWRDGVSLPEFGPHIVADLLDDLDAAERREAALLDIVVLYFCPADTTTCPTRGIDACKHCWREWLDRMVGS
jgi:hypothetical protein